MKEPSYTSQEAHDIVKSVLREMELTSIRDGKKFELPDFVMLMLVELAQMLKAAVKNEAERTKICGFLVTLFVHKADLCPFCVSGDDHNHTTTH